MQIEVVPGVSTELGEGPVWDAARRCLWFVDIMRGHVHRFEPDTGRDRMYEVGQPVGAVACPAGGDVLCAVRDGFARLDPESGMVTMVASVEADNPRNRMNDGNLDARGRFWAGTMSMHRERGKGGLYRLDPDGTVTQHLSGVTTSNGRINKRTSATAILNGLGQPALPPCSNVEVVSVLVKVLLLVAVMALLLALLQR